MRGRPGGTARIPVVNGCRRELQAGCLGDRKGVHIRTEGSDPVPRQSPAQDPHDAIPGDAGADLVEAKGPQMTCDQCGCGSLAVGELRVLVQPVTERDQLGTARPGHAVNKGAELR